MHRRQFELSHITSKHARFLGLFEGFIIIDPAIIWDVRG
jgi:hypothetical protein